MAHKILIYGPSGWGKTSSIRNLDPKTTAIINIDRKALPLAKWRENYKTVLDSDGKLDLAKSNYVEPRKPSSVLLTLQAWNKRDDIKTIVVDTITHMMMNQFMSTIMDKGYDKFSKLGSDTHKVLDYIRDMDSKNVIVFAHNDIAYDSDGQKVNKLRSFGKLVDEKVEPFSMFSTVLAMGVRVDPTDKSKREVFFQTQSDGSTMSKSPAYFDGDSHIPALDYEVPNDVALVLEKLDEFEN